MKPNLIVRRSDGELLLTVCGEGRPLIDARAAKRIFERTLGWGWVAAPLPQERPDAPGYRLDWSREWMRVIVTCGDYGPDGWWQHASMSLRDRVPTYEELKVLHKATFGSAWAYQVFAPPDSHVNIHEHVLHLWGRVEVDDPDAKYPQAVRSVASLPLFGATGSI